LYWSDDPTNSVSTDAQPGKWPIHEARIIKTQSKEYNKKTKYTQHHEDQRYRCSRKMRAKPSKIKAWSSRPACNNCLYHCFPL